MVYIETELNSYVGAENPYALDTYHPYRGGTNPQFDDYSELILDFKRGETDVIEKFRKEIDGMLKSNICIVTFPSHDPENTNSSVRRLGMSLSTSTRTDGTRCLYRHKKIPKQANGGGRSVERHISSINIRDAHILSGKPVLLLDDVTTTGTSLKAGECLLQRAGVSRVHCLVLARTASYRARHDPSERHRVADSFEARHDPIGHLGYSPDGLENHHDWPSYYDIDDFRL